jgi:hypothetical protein
MKKRTLAAVAAIIIIVLVAVLLVENNFLNTTEVKGTYVGVAYCGNSVEEGKALIDKVKTYTNLFVLQSSLLQRDYNSVNELGDYAVSSGLYFLPYFGFYVNSTFSAWLEGAKQKWGSRFLGVYYSDEAGGRMLDDNVEFQNALTGGTVKKTRYGDVVLQQADGVVIHYEFDGNINLYEPIENPAANETEGAYSTFYPDGTVTGQHLSNSDFKTYADLMSVRPFKTPDEVAEQFLARDPENMAYLRKSTTVFTSDYALFWWDYLTGYDVLLAQVGWNLTLNQQISLVRGTATQQNKDWGVDITWKYTNPPYLDNGTEILSQMRTAYECGAKYFVLFNYYEDNGNPYGTMKDEHFRALETFWNDIVKNPEVEQGSVKADSVLVLPHNYAWGMRWREDKIWGVIKADNQTSHLWDLKQSAFENHGLKLDIIYEDAMFPLKIEYQQVYRWNQTQPTD